MVYGRLPFQLIKNTAQLMWQLFDPKMVIEFQSIGDSSLTDVLKGFFYIFFVSNRHQISFFSVIFNKCLKYEQHDRYSIEELLNHPFLTSL